MYCFKSQVATSTPVARASAGTNLAGDPIHKFGSKTGGSIASGDGSGDTAHYSADSRYLALIDTEGLPSDGQWYVYDRLASEFKTLHRRNLGTAVNFRFSWGPSGNDFVYLDGSAGSTTLLSQNITGGINWQRSLPSTIPGPGGGPTVAVQWRLGVCSGDQIQILQGFATIAGEEHHFIRPFDATTGLDIGTGFWIQDNTSGVATKCHNCWCGLGGVIYSPISSNPNFAQHIIFWSDWDGTQFVQIEPNTPGSTANWWTHQSVSGNRIMYGGLIDQTGPVTRLVVEEFNNGPSSTDRTSICEIDGAVLRNCFGEPNPNAVSYWHGELVGSIAVVSLLNSTTNQFVIASLDVDSCTLTTITAPMSATASFLSSARPSISPDGSEVAWHAGEPTCVFQSPNSGEEK